MSYFSSKKAVVEFVKEKLANSKAGSVLTMTIGRDKFGDYFAHTVIDELSDGIGLIMEPDSSRLRMSTSPETTSDG
jgi:hypothetical protein